MLDKLRGLVTANRIVALIGLAGAAAAFIASLQTSLIPGSPPAEAASKAVVALAAVVSFLKIVQKFLDGSQQWDALTAGAAEPDGDAEPDPEELLDDPESVEVTDEHLLHEHPGTPVQPSQSGLAPVPADTAPPARPKRSRRKPAATAGAAAPGGSAT